MGAEDIIREIPWVEKYRPTSLSEVVSQTLTIESLNEFVKKQTLPHCIFTGPAGTGKTSAALALINDLVGKNNLTQDVILERNASDEARMEDLDDIKNFVFHTGINEKVRFKFVIMDEADNINKDVQSAFRRIIEMAPANVKFFFLCNYVEKIIDPILSRCAVFRFYPLPKQEFFKQLSFIAKKENVPLTAEMADAIFYITQGDMRQSINLFQMSVALILDEMGKIDDSKINGDLIYEISGFIPLNKFEKLYSGCIKGEFKRTAMAIRGLRGISSRGMLRQFLTKIIDTIHDHPLQERLINKIAEYDYRLTLEADPSIQIDAFIADLTNAIMNR